MSDAIGDGPSMMWAGVAPADALAGTPQVASTGRQSDGHAELAEQEVDELGDEGREVVAQVDGAAAGSKAPIEPAGQHAAGGRAAGSPMRGWRRSPRPRR